MANVRTAGAVSRICVIHRPSPDTQCTVVRRISTTCMQLRYYVPALSVSVVFEWRVWNTAIVSACSVLGPRPIWRLLFCAPGIARYMSRHEESRIATSLRRLGPFGSGARRRNRL